MPFDGTNQTEEQLIVNRMIEMLADPANWGQGVFHENGRMCLLAAWLGASGSHAVLDAMSRLVGRKQVAGRKIVEFNDDPNTTHADIMDFLYKLRASV